MRGKSCLSTSICHTNSSFGLLTDTFGAQVMHKAPVLESKQIEHVLNERRILEEASGHPFCVGLVRAYQDKPCLYLLQEWVGGQSPVIPS